MSIISISQTQVDTTAAAQEGVPEICKSWSLTKEDAQEFLALSGELKPESFYHEYDTAPCSISGVLDFDGRVWNFTINGAAKAILKSGDTVRYMGCDKPACSSLVMWRAEESGVESYD